MTRPCLLVILPSLLGDLHVITSHICWMLITRSLADLCFVLHDTYSFIYDDSPLLIRLLSPIHWMTCLVRLGTLGNKIISSCLLYDFALFVRWLLLLFDDILLFIGWHSPVYRMIPLCSLDGSPMIIGWFSLVCWMILPCSLGDLNDTYTFPRRPCSIHGMTLQWLLGDIQLFTWWPCLLHWVT